MDQHRDEQALDLRKHLQTLRARKWSIFLTIALVVGAAMGVSYLQTPVYQAEARVLVHPLSTPGSTTIQPVDVQTESQVIASEPVANLVLKALDLREPVPRLLGNLTVTNANTSATITSFATAQVLILRYSSTDPELARDVVNQFGQSYIEYRRKQTLQSFLTAQDAVQRRIQSASDQLDEATNQLADATKSGDTALVNALETQRSVIISRLGVLQQRLDDLQPDQAARSGGAEIIQEAGTPSSPVSPDFVKNGALAAVVGICLGIGFAYLRERLDDRFRGRDDIEEALEAPVLATVPKFTIAKKEATPHLITSGGKGVASEAYRTLRTNLQFVLAQRGGKSLVITSASAGEGKTATTANLAVTIAQAGVRVIVVSADLRRPTMEKYFAVDRRHGLSTFLDSSDTNPMDVIRDPGIPNLRVIPCGPIPDNPAELLVSPRLAQLLDFLDNNSDLTLIDTPPLLAVADGAIMSSRCGGTLLVINAGVSARSACIHARDQLERAGGELVGVVLNAYDPQSSPYYYAPYDYSSGYASEVAAATNGGTDAPKKSDKRASRSLFGFRR